MTWYCIYNISDNSIEGTANYHLDDSIYAGKGQAQFIIPDGISTDNYMIDTTQSPPVLVPLSS